jgi:hypothetical protein
MMDSKQEDVSPKPDKTIQRKPFKVEEKKVEPILAPQVEPF